MDFNIIGQGPGRRDMDLMQRIERLERSNRRLKLALTSLVAILAGSLLLGQAASEKIPDVIRARKFEVVSETGAAVVELRSWELGGWIETKEKSGLLPLFHVAATDGGEGTVTTSNGKGQDLVKLTASEGGKGVVITSNARGQELVRLGVTEGGEGGVVTSNGKGQDLVKLWGMKGGEGAVVTSNGKGQDLVALGATEAGEGMVVTMNGKGQEVVKLLASEDGGAIGVLNKTGELSCTMGVDEYGNGKIGAWDRNGKGKTLTPGP